MHVEGLGSDAELGRDHRHEPCLDVPHLGLLAGSRWRAFGRHGGAELGRQGQVPFTDCVERLGFEGGATSMALHLAARGLRDTPGLEEHDAVDLNAVLLGDRLPNRAHDLVDVELAGALLRRRKGLDLRVRLPTIPGLAIRGARHLGGELLA